MKRLASLIAASLVTGATCVASDSDPLGFYIGGAVGRSDVRSGVLNPAPYGSVPFDERSIGWTALIGIRPVSFFSAELAYLDFGHPSGVTDMIEPGVAFNWRSNVLERAPTLSGLFYLPIPAPDLDLYGRAGVARLSSRGTSDFISITCTTNCPYLPVGLSFAPTPFSRTDTDFLYGAGVQLKLSALAVRLEYERVADRFGDPDLLSVGLIWIF